MGSGPWVGQGTCVRQWGAVSEPIYCFERDPYRTRLTTEILDTGESKTGPYVVLRDTLFYPEGGGQPCDLGTVGEGRLEAVHRSGSQIRHYLDRPLRPGPVELQLDWQRRFDHMQQHTAQHLLSALTLEHFGWETRSFHIGPELSDIEVATPLPERTQLGRIEDLVAEVVRRAIPVVDRRVTPMEFAELEVRSRGLPDGHAGDIRLVEIEGVDINTCGGTHVRSTAEIEAVKIVRSAPLRGGTRLYWVAGRRVRRRLGRLENRASELRSLLDTGDDEIAATVSRHLRLSQELRRKIRDLETALSRAIVDRALLQDATVLEIHLQGIQTAAMRSVTEELQRRCRNNLSFVTTMEGQGGRFALVAGESFTGDLSRIGSQLCKILGGRGGGKGSIFQGKYEATEKRSEAASFLRSQFE